MNKLRTASVFLASCLLLTTVSCSSKPDVSAESKPADFTGFWKGTCTDAFGVQIKKETGNLFSVSFCGPGGCFEPGQWMPNTPIVGDPQYRVLNATTLEIKKVVRWDRYLKCTTDTNPVLDYATMPAPSPADSSGIVVFKSNEGLPDYAHKSPFTANASASEALRQRFDEVTAALKPCKVGDVDVPDLGKTPLFSNICNKAQSDAIRKLVAELAPDLTFETTAAWEAAVTSSGEPELLVNHIDISNNQHFRYPYLSVWRLDLKNGRLNAQFGGSFLAGEIHAIRPFGREDNFNKVFVKHQSCIECEPWVYLSVLDFSKESAKPIKFTYAEDHKDYGETIEYQLPGMGHSIDAKVETRIPKRDASAIADLMQAFRYTEEKKEEWWVFSCKSGQCDYQMYDALPERYRASWASGDKL